MLSTFTWTRLLRKRKPTSPLRIWRSTWPTRRWKSSQESVKKPDRCYRTCTWLIARILRTRAYPRSLLESLLQLGSLKLSSEYLSLSQRCTCNQLSQHSTFRKLIESSRFQHWTLRHQAWIVTVGRSPQSCRISWGGLKRPSREESQLVQESHTQNSIKSWWTDLTTIEPLIWVSLRWSRETSSSITKAEKSSKGKDEARSSLDCKFANCTTFH